MVFLLEAVHLAVVGLSALLAARIVVAAAVLLLLLLLDCLQIVVGHSLLALKQSTLQVNFWAVLANDFLELQSLS